MKVSVPTKKSIEDELAKTGTRWSCLECKVSGILLAKSKVSQTVRKTTNTPVGKECSIQFNECIQHQENSDD